MHQTDAHVERRAGTIILAAVILALVLAACGSGSAAGPQFDAAQPGDGARGGAAVAEPAGKGDESGSSAAPDAALASAERQVVKTGEITIRVPNVANALAGVRATALKLGGYVGGSQAGTLEDSAALTLRVPAPRFDDALAALHEIEGDVIVEATREEDVTASIVDLTARIANLEASEAQYRALLARAEKIDDVLNVQSRLDDVRGQIEQLKGQLKSVSGQADLATLTVTLTPAAQPVQQATDAWDPGATASQALAALVSVGQGLASVGIWFAIVWLPVLLVLGLIALVLFRALLELRRRVPPAAPTDTSVG
jgi:hypothetical protein